jgi:hypothetical protein
VRDYVLQHSIERVSAEIEAARLTGRHFTPKAMRHVVGEWR